MSKKIVSIVIIITMLCGMLPVVALEEMPEVVLTEPAANNELTVDINDIPVLPYSQAKGKSLTESISLSSEIETIEPNDYLTQYSIKMPVMEDTISIPANAVVSENIDYKSANEIIPEYSNLRESLPVAESTDAVLTESNASIMSSRSSSSSAVDASYRLSTINGKDAFALQNQTGRTSFIGDNIGEEYIDPLTGNLIVTETDLVLPGVDGFDLKLSRYYSLAQAEVFTKSVDVVSSPKTITLNEGTYVVVEEAHNFDTGQTSTYYYPYEEWADASLRIEEIESRDTCNGLYMYDAWYYTSNEGDTITLDYYYKSEINSTSYQHMRNNLGAGWSWSFPSVQVIKDDYMSEDMPKALYYHDGKGNVMAVNFDNPAKCSFENYVGGDIIFEIGYYYDTDISSTSRIDYIVEDADGTEYYFGMYGELRTIMDIYGNRIQFQYDSADYYGAEDMPRLAEIIDSVGRVIGFDYTTNYDCENITVTVKESANAEDDITLTYTKQLVDITNDTVDAEGNIIDSELISTEQFLTSFTNAEGEITNYIPSIYEEERSFTQPILFSLSDKTFTTPTSEVTKGYANNVVYLLGNIVRPHSHSYYTYDLCVRNLGRSGVSQAFRVATSGEYMPVVEPISSDMVEIKYHYYKEDNYHTYSDDYTGYPYYSSIDNIPDGYVATTVEEKENSRFVRHYYKEDDAVLEKITIASYENPTGEDLYVKSEVEDYFDRQPKMTKITYSNNQNFNGYTYDSYVYTNIENEPGKTYGKPLMVTEELDHNTAIGSDRNKHAMHYTYDEDTGFLLSKEWYKSSSVKCTEEYTYDNNNRISQIKLADGTTTTYAYEYTNGHVSKITSTTPNETGSTIVEERYTAATNYSLPSTVTKTVTENGNSSTQTTTYTYDMLLGVVKTETDDDGNITYYEYDDLGRPTRIVYPRYTTYSSYGTPDIEILPVENIVYESVLRDYDEISGDDKLMCQSVTTTVAYYDVTDLDIAYPTNADLENVSKTHYEAQTNYYLGTGEIIESNIVDKLEAGGSSSILTTTYYYNATANTVTVVDPQGNETVTQYDGLGREVQITDAFDNNHIMEYNISSDGVGFKAQSYFVPADDADAKENIVEYKYDRLQRVVSEKGYSSYPDDFSEVQYAYDYVGNVIGITDANGNLNSNGYTQSNTYDKLNRLTSTKNANNEIIRNLYDNAGNITKQTLTDSKGAESILYQRSYDGEGKLISDTDNAGNSNTYQYNNLGQLVRYWDKDNKLYNASYNELGIQDTMTKTIDEGTITSRHYSHKNPYGANAVYDVRGVYDETSGNYHVQMNEVGVYSYSPTGKLLEQKTLYNQSTYVNNVYFEPYMSYSYDANGNLLSAYNGLYDETNSAVWGFATNYEYDKNRLKKVQIDGNIERDTTDNANVRYEYYADGKLKSVTYPALTDNSILKSEYVYDGLSRLTSLTNYKGTDILSRYAYTYDSNGNILTTNETVGATQHSTTYTYDKLNRIASVAGTKGADSYYEYDARGNRKANYEQIDFLSEEDAIFQYNEEDKLIYSGVGDDATRFWYSANGYRYLKQENSTYPEFYVYDSNGRLNIIARPVNLGLANGATITAMYPITQYIWGPDRVLAKIDKLTGSSYYYLYNGHGDVVQIVDTAGNVVNSYDYDVWGNFLTKEETIDNHFTYFGQTYDETTGLYYLRARYYDPSTGRFTQQDPAEDGYNWYVYGNQNPVMFIDLWGLYKLETDKGGNVYAVTEHGDTLSGIAVAEVNDASAWTKIGYKGNPFNVQVGEKININNIYNKNYPRPIQYENYYTIDMGDKSIKVALNKNIIRTSLVDGDARYLLTSNSQNAILMALIEKKFYRDVFGEDIDISDISLAVELLGHVYPQLILDKANLSEKVKNANVVDAGTLSVDNNRKVWDKISGKMSIDKYLDIFMK